MSPWTSLCNTNDRRWDLNGVTHLLSCWIWQSSETIIFRKSSVKRYPQSTKPYGTVVSVIEKSLWTYCLSVPSISTVERTRLLTKRITGHIILQREPPFRVRPNEHRVIFFICSRDVNYRESALRLVDIRIGGLRYTVEYPEPHVPLTDTCSSSTPNDTTLITSGNKDGVLRVQKTVQLNNRKFVPF